MKKILSLKTGRVLGNYCGECGNPSWNTDKYCEYCGAKLDEDDNNNNGDDDDNS